MMLCLDCGNTRLKWAIRSGGPHGNPHGNGDWLASGALPCTEIAQLVQQLPAGYKPQTAIGCNVAGAQRAKQIEAALAMPVRWIDASEHQCGVANGYDSPSSLGADRWAALVGAHALHRGAALVVLAGTATTIDVLEPDGVFRGGLILPGVTLMQKALAAGTANLPELGGSYHANTQTAPRNTHDAIASGAIHATLGAIERMFAMLSRQDGALCLLSGGAAESLLPHLDLPVRRIDNLVLEGLACIARDPDFRPS